MINIYLIIYLLIISLVLSLIKLLQNNDNNDNNNNNNQCELKLTGQSFPLINGRDPFNARPKMFEKSSTSSNKVGSWFCGNEPLNGFLDWCTCPVGFTPSYVTGIGYICNGHGFWGDFFIAISTLSTVAVFTAPYVFEAAEVGVLLESQLGTDLEATLTAAGVACTAVSNSAGPAIWFEIWKYITKSQSQNQVIKIPDWGSSPEHDNLVLCPWNHGWGGRGLTACNAKEGCDASNVSTTGCATPEWCQQGTTLFPGKRCTCSWGTHAVTNGGNGYGCENGWGAVWGDVTCKDVDENGNRVNTKLSIDGDSIVCSYASTTENN